MEAWSVYLAICVDNMLSHAPSLVVYQCYQILNKYYTSFGLSLAAFNPILQWDTHHPYLCHQYITLVNAQKPRWWPCPYFGATNHYTGHCPFCPCSLKQTLNRQWNANREESDLQFTGNPSFNKDPVPSNPNQSWDTTKISPTLHATNYSIYPYRNLGIYFL